jgi:hypothetical protein
MIVRPHRAQAVADDAETRVIGLDVGERVERFVEPVGLLDQEQSIADGRVGASIPTEPGMKIAVHEQAPGAPDVEEQGPERPPQLGILRTVLHEAAGEDAGARQEGEGRGQPDGEPAPDGQTDGRRFHGHHLGAAAPSSTDSSDTSRSKKSSTVQSSTTRSR